MNKSLSYSIVHTSNVFKIEDKKSIVKLPQTPMSSTSLVCCTDDLSSALFLLSVFVICETADVVLKATAHNNVIFVSLSGFRRGPDMLFRRKRRNPNDKPAENQIKEIFATKKYCMSST